MSNTFSPHTRHLALFVVTAHTFLAFAGLCQAEVTTYEFTGTVWSEFWSDPFFPSWDPQVGDTVEGSFTIDTSIPLEWNEGDAQLEYVAPLAMEVTVAEHQFATSFYHASLTDDSHLFGDHFGFYSNYMANVTEPSFVGLSLFLGFTDDKGELIRDQRLAESLLETTPSDAWLTIEFTGPGIGFSIDEITTISPRVVGDFDGDGQVGVVDIDLLGKVVQEAEKIRESGWAPEVTPAFDLDGDMHAGYHDLDVLVQEIIGTSFGDANLDGEFNSSDMVDVFTAGMYETGEAAGWSEGDWNADGLFTTSDMVVAFTDGGYEQGPRAGVVPEPTGLLLPVFIIAIVFCRRRECPMRKT